jgi:hypothetical protein
MMDGENTKRKLTLSTKRKKNKGGANLLKWRESLT